MFKLAIRILMQLKEYCLQKGRVRAHNDNADNGKQIKNLRPVSHN